MKVNKSNVRYMPLIGPPDEAGEIQRRAFDQAFNIENPPPTAEEYAQHFRKRPASEELKRATRLEDATGV
jgi:hypothetical protein